MAELRQRSDPCEPEGVAVMPSTPCPNFSGGAVIALPTNEELREALRAFRPMPAPRCEECTHA